MDGGNASPAQPIYHFGRILLLKQAFGGGAMRRILLVGLAAMLASCGSPQSVKEEVEQAEEVVQPQALLANNATPAVSLEPIRLDDDQRRQLLRAFAFSEKAARVLRRKSETGRVELSAGGRLDLVEAERNLEDTQARLAELSESGLPTLLLLHQISPDRFLWSWLIGPDGLIAVDRSPERFEGLDHVVDGLGVTRLAATRSRRNKGEPPPTKKAERAAERADQTPQSRRMRKQTLRNTREAILPGTVGAALGKSAGRLLVIAAEDTGTAPYAALPLDNGFAAQNWSFVVAPDLKTLASEEFTFDYRSIDLAKAVIVGDPDLSKDPLFDWDPLPGAKREAETVAKQFGIPKENVLIGEEATQRSFRRAINRMSGEGLVYIASHAVADPQNPLTRGFVAMTGEHYYAGYIRQEKFSDWKSQPPLVVVSACQTALGRVLDGGGFGVSQSWYEAGAGQVAGSLWNVSDKATLILMHYFTLRLKEGDAPEIAMQYAQNKTMLWKDGKGNQPFFDDPKMWASFSIFGKPSRDVKS
jgi:hypothetical protein